MTSEMARLKTGLDRPKVYQLMWYGNADELRQQLKAGDEVVLWHSGYTRDTASYAKVLRTTKTQIILEREYGGEGDRYYKADGKRYGSRSGGSGTRKTLYALTPELRQAIDDYEATKERQAAEKEVRADALKRVRGHKVWNAMTTDRLVGMISVLDDWFDEIEEAGDVGCPCIACPAKESCCWEDECAAFVAWEEGD